MKESREFEFIISSGKQFQSAIVLGKYSELKLMFPSYALKNMFELVVCNTTKEFFSSANIFDFFFTFETSLAHSGEKSGKFIKLTRMKTEL